MKRFWVSWYEPDGDFRPVYDPKKESEPFDHLYWCSGLNSEAWIMCAVVDAASEKEAKKAVRKYWPTVDGWRFCEEKPQGWMPDAGRFPRKKQELLKGGE